ncbi:MAG: alpha/beta hydrolase domain-containing protein, partial [Actinomycetota bacterium]|nr:alpha/beta hydrolase domain-containing protein [Actinomycetota bacterium]
HDDPHPDVRVHHVAGTQHSAGVVPQLFEDPYFGTKGQHGFNTVDYRPVVRALLAQLVQWASGVAEPGGDVVPELAQMSDRRSVLRQFERGGYNVPEPDSFGLPEGPVPAVDGSSNELGGIRLPDIAVPIGVHTGWNVRHPDIGASNQQLLLRGSTWFDDERPDLDGYLDQVRSVLAELVDQRLVLASDVEMMVDQARARWHC